MTSRENVIYYSRKENEMAKAKGLAALNKVAGGTKSPARKSSTPVCQVSDAVDQAMAEFKAAKTDLDNAKARKLNAEIQMMDEAHGLRLRECKNSGKLHASVKLVGQTSLTFTQKSQCLKMVQDDCEPKIRSIVGSDDDFDRYFDVKGNFTIDEKALMSLENADEIAEAIVRALGENVHILNREAIIVPTDQFYNDKVFDLKVARMAERLEEEGLAVPHKASFK
ncbi:hypothetical protein LCGC14_1988880 [marine sediment metagenome]|uniref:Uncharacterized protein n=1 Tax=marine sediment metagenome TaxID=412755 RepID=A0A0F9F6G8_9ZZZZ